MYNLAQDKIVELPRQLVIANGSTVLTSSLTEAELNAEGYYKVQYNSQPNRRYYTSVESKLLVGNAYTATYTPVDKPLADVKVLLKSSIKERFLDKEANPIVDTGLGFSVNGGRKNIEDFKVGQKYSFPSVKASDNIFYPITNTDYDTIVTALEMNGILLYQTKWAKEAEVEALLTVADCELYEATPYDYVVTQADVDADITNTLVLGDVQVRYTNQCRDW